MVLRLLRMLDLEFLDWDEQAICYAPIENAPNAICQGIFKAPEGLMNRFGQTRTELRCWGFPGHKGECFWVDDTGYWDTIGKVFHGPSIRRLSK